MAVAEKNIMRQRGAGARREPKEFDERVVEIARVSRVAKGGRRIRFRALVVLGDHKGRVGMGVAKANEVALAVKKATTKAKKQMVTVPIVNGTIPHEVNSKHGGSKIMLKPATSGTSIVAGGSVRVVADVVGITDMLAKSLGSANKINNVTATIKALTSFNEEITEKVRGFEKNKVSAEAPQPKEAKEAVPVEKAVKTPTIAKGDIGVPTESVGKAPAAKKKVEKK